MLVYFPYLFQMFHEYCHQCSFKTLLFSFLESHFMICLFFHRKSPLIVKFQVRLTSIKIWTWWKYIVEVSNVNTLKCPIFGHSYLARFTFHCGVPVTAPLKPAPLMSIHVDFRSLGAMDLTSIWEVQRTFGFFMLLVGLLELYAIYVMLPEYRELFHRLRRLLLWDTTNVFM